jgi:hypothetical protein
LGAELDDQENPMDTRIPQQLLLSLGFALPSLAAASNHCTAITALPATLSEAGVYCLTDDLKLAGSSGTAVTIATDSVTLDLDGHALRSKAAANTTTIGVSVVGRKYFSIVNGTLAGFAQAVYVRSNGDTPAKGGVLANLKVQRSFWNGLSIICDGCVVRDNVVTDTVVPETLSGYFANAIGVEGSGDLIIGNRVYNTASPPGVQAVAFALGTTGSTISNNFAANAAATSDPVYGFLMSGVDDLLVANQAQNLRNCYWLQEQRMKYRDNLSGGCGTAFGGGLQAAIDLGGNN